MRNSFIFGALLLLTACTPGPAVVQTDLPDQESPGASLLMANCTQCHGVPSPQNHTAEEWDSVVRRMQNWRVTKGFSAITSADEEQLLAYLKKYAKK